MKSKIIIGLLSGLGLFSACNDVWDEHYDRNGSVPNVNLMELIRQDEALSTFARILEKTGADSLLVSSQTYTVWAPVNEALKNVNMNDEAALRRLVNNHIARYTSPTSTATNKYVYMLNGKKTTYSADGKFNGATIIGADHVAENGLMHKLSDTITYRFNFWEYISVNENYSKVYNFLKRFNKKVYSPSLSAGDDSVFVDYNPLLEHRLYGIGMINNEDSLYTMILPDNAAWDVAYARVSPYFANYNKDQAVADSIRDVQAGQAIVNGLTFRGRIDNPAVLDSLVTVYGAVIREPSRYLQSYAKMEASNGLMYLAGGNLFMDDTCTWNYKIPVEAEDVNYRTIGTGSNAYVRNTEASNLVQGISQNSYLEVSRASGVAEVTFKIPQLLAGKYDIYVDFVPPIVDGVALAQEKTRLEFRLTYPKVESSGTSNMERKGRNDDELIIGGHDVEDNKIISLKVWGGVEFPAANYYDNMWFANEENSMDDMTIRTTLRIRTNLNTDDLNNGMRRRFRVDRIRFVPVP